MSNVGFREAVSGDVSSIAALLADDDLGQTREQLDDPAYLAAFQAMENEPHNTLIVGEIEGVVVAVYQLTVISGVSLKGTRRAQIEGVRVASHLRGQGVGRLLIEDAEYRAGLEGAGLMQFTTNVAREKAHQFYSDLGYQPSHVGFKKPL
ncbi:GNAT family N-acetyltransferase [Rhodobacteraceae bacterium]|nr:GNAT family N-acetyltransferase [Paracoccaceae bacterium]